MTDAAIIATAWAIGAAAWAVWATWPAWRRAIRRAWRRVNR